MPRGRKRCVLNTKISLESNDVSLPNENDCDKSVKVNKKRSSDDNLAHKVCKRMKITDYIKVDETISQDKNPGVEEVLNELNLDDDFFNLEREKNIASLEILKLNPVVVLEINPQIQDLARKLKNSDCDNEDEYGGFFNDNCIQEKEEEENYDNDDNEIANTNIDEQETDYNNEENQNNYCNYEQVEFGMTEPHVSSPDSKNISDHEQDGFGLSETHISNIDSQNISNSDQEEFRLSETHVSSSDSLEFSRESCTSNGSQIIIKKEIDLQEQTHTYPISNEVVSSTDLQMNNNNNWIGESYDKIACYNNNFIPSIQLMNQTSLLQNAMCMPTMNLNPNMIVPMNYFNSNMMLMNSGGYSIYNGMQNQLLFNPLMQNAMFTAQNMGMPLFNPMQEISKLQSAVMNLSSQLSSIQNSIIMQSSATNFN